MSKELATNIVDYVLATAQREQCIEWVEGLLEPNRCSTCKFWDSYRRVLPNSNRGHCTKLFDQIAILSYSEAPVEHDRRVAVDGDFGCVLWEAKE